MKPHVPRMVVSAVFHLCYHHDRFFSTFFFFLTWLLIFPWRSCTSLPFLILICDFDDMRQQPVLIMDIQNMPESAHPLTFARFPLGRHVISLKSLSWKNELSLNRKAHGHLSHHYIPLYLSEDPQHSSSLDIPIPSNKAQIWAMLVITSDVIA